MVKAHLLGGHAAAATSATMPRHLWMDAVVSAVVAHGVCADWLRDTQRERLNRAYTSGEAVWMAADAMRGFWSGVQRAAREDADGFSHIRAAVRR